MTSLIITFFSLFDMFILYVITKTIVFVHEVICHSFLCWKWLFLVYSLSCRYNISVYYFAAIKAHKCYSCVVGAKSVTLFMTFLK